MKRLTTPDNSMKKLLETISPAGCTAEKFQPPYAISFGPAERFLGAKDVQALLGIKKAGLYKLMADEPSFPPPIRIGKRRVAWLESEIIIYLNSRIAERNSKYGYDKNDSLGGQP